jgi:hypothetical protein
LATFHALVPVEHVRRSLVYHNPMSKPIIPVQAPTDSSTPPSRKVVDSDGGHWHVYEQAFGDYDRRIGRSLIFNSEFAVRRVRNFPDDWLELSDLDLMELSWMA